MFNRFLSKAKFDWWEFTHLGWIGYVHYLIDWVKYLIGYSSYRPNLFAYSEIDMDLDFEDLNNEKHRTEK